MSKIFDCITFFDNNLMFEIRYNILFKHVHKFIVCESAYDHSGKKKKKNFIWKSYYKKDKIKHLFMKDAFPKKNSRWENQALQREYLLDNLNFVSPEDYIFFSDPDEIMKPENIAVITDEALRIPQWTAWPEKTHYSSPDDDEEGDDESESREDSPYPATWTVFPLCHTFPANIVENRKWIGKTCNFVPRTAALLEGLGPALRTALFSRLEPRTTLSAHTGWADLANHVLRLHIPLVVPGGSHNLGLCGTWVDGNVETHRMGEVVCFDDSKVHRAFNYTDEERIVLIVDLARTDALPLGTATGGHTEELDKFIQELT